MITGDNPLTAATIAAEAGVDDYIAEATPQAKLERIRAEQKNGHLVAMIGDGTNDAPALAQADVGVAMSSGTQVAREAGNMVDLDSNPTKLIDIIEVGKEQLMTRGCADHVQHRQRRRQVFRHPAGHVPRALRDGRRRGTPVGAEHHAARFPAERGPFGSHLQRAHHRRPDSPGAARGPLPGHRGRAHPAAQPAHLRRWEASSRRSSASRRSTSSSTPIGLA